MNSEEYKRKLRDLRDIKIVPNSFNAFKQTIFAKVDLDGNEVIPKKANMVSVDGLKGNKILPDFVASNLFQFLEHISKKKSEKVFKETSVINKLKIEKCFMDPVWLYHKKQIDFLEKLLFFIHHQHLTLNVPDEIIDVVLEVLDVNFGSVLNLSTFVSSKFCPMECSGMFVSLTDSQFSDVNMAKNFYFSDDYEFYANSLRYFGFLVDLHYPWRIVFDLKSPAAKETFQSLGINDIFSERYDRICDLEIQNLRSIITNFWNVYSKKNAKVNCRLRQISSDQFKDEQLIDLFVRSKAKEYNVSLTDNEKRSLINEATMWEKNGGSKMFYLTQITRKLWTR